MKSISEIRRARLKAAIRERWGGNKSAFARAMGFDQASLAYRLLAGPEAKTGKNIGSELARKIERVAGLPENWLDQPPSVPACMVPLLEVRASAGNGLALADRDTIVGDIPLAPEWVRRNLPGISSPGALRIITAYGDSMIPAFSDGDVLVVDTGVSELRADAIYVLARDGELFVKRIQRLLDGLVRVISDNSVYGPQTVAPPRSCGSSVGWCSAGRAEKCSD